jgi:hypothetical protein
MFDQILEAVKEHLGNNPQISSAIPADQQDAVHQEIATYIHNGLINQTTTQSGSSGLLSMLEGSMASGGPLVNAIEGGLVGSLGSKFGLSPMVTGLLPVLYLVCFKNLHNVKSPANNSTVTIGYFNFYILNDE